MAEGLCRHMWSGYIEAYSAGIVKHGLNPLAVKAMHEINIDISGHRSKTITELEGIEFDCVITVCDHAHEVCPVYPGETKVIHRGFEDPPKLALEAANDEEALKHYRRVRDEIRDFIHLLPSAFNAEPLDI